MSADRLEFPPILAVVLPPMVTVLFENEDGALKTALEIVLGLKMGIGVLITTVLAPALGLRETTVLSPLVPSSVGAVGLLPPFVLAFVPGITPEGATGPPVAELELPSLLTPVPASDIGEAFVLCPPSTGPFVPEGLITVSAPELEGKIVLSPPLTG